MWIVDSGILEGICSIADSFLCRHYSSPFERVCFVVFLHCSSIYMFERESVLVVAALCEPVTVKDTA